MSTSPAPLQEPLEIGGTSRITSPIWRLFFQHLLNSVEIAEGFATSKQDTLVSGTNIKTINGSSLLGSGDIALQALLVSGVNIKTINNISLLGSGDMIITTPTPNGGF